MQYPVSPGRIAGRSVIMVALAGLLSACEPQTFERAGGQELEWQSLRGQWVLVNYWAEWCKPCLEEIPELNRVDQASDITVLGVNFDGISGEALAQLGNRMGIEFDLLAQDPAGELGWQSPDGLPATYVVTPEGELQGVRLGPQTEEGIRTLIRGSDSKN